MPARLDPAGALPLVEQGVELAMAGQSSFLTKLGCQLMQRLGPAESLLGRSSQVPSKQRPVDPIIVELDHRIRLNPVPPEDGRVVHEEPLHHGL